LAELVRAAHGGPSPGFLMDETRRLDMLSLARRTCQASLHGHSVLLALPDQFATAAALIQLDGVARRIVLWPQDAAHDDIDAVISSAAVDDVIRQWPLADDGVSPAGRLPQSGASLNTEWVLLTSGTTGRPKLVVHTLQSLAGHLQGMKVPVAGAPVWTTFYDIRRYGGLQILFRALLGGGSLVLSSASEKPAAYLARAGAAKVTHMLGTPSHWRRALMADAQVAVSPIYVRLSGEVADQAILDRLRASFPAAAIVHAFASTEAGLAFEVGDGQAGFPESLIGKAVGPAIRVSGGALQIRSARTAAGTLNGRVDPIADRDGFVDTGDLVTLRDGRYQFVGRRDGVINVGGQKVHPEEVEEVINAHPSVQMSLVSARRSPIMGAVVVADIVCKPGRTAPQNGNGSLAADIATLCRSRLAPHKVPATIRMVPSLTIAPSGKLVRMRA
jgi:acyl-CoA synthetase (AMP-forming)/AMP-acid ligase II